MVVLEEKPCIKCKKNFDITVDEFSTQLFQMSNILNSFKDEISRLFCLKLFGSIAPNIFILTKLFLIVLN